MLGVLSLSSACASGGEDDAFTFGPTTFTTVAEDDEIDSDTSDTATSEETTGDGDTSTTGDGDTSTTTTTGDGDTTTTTTTGDGDTTTTGGDDCGNGVIDPGETCDGLNFNGASCMVLGYDGGSLTCNANCAVDFTGCTNAPQPGLGQLYSTCLDSANCPGLDGCATVTNEGEVDPFDGYCTNLCTTDADCFANTGGSAVPQCNDEADPYCELDCSGGKTCPGGMECLALVGGKELCY
ncbi:hypothetical protein ACNOYE_29960 [Nannocystaceae bacterium ST9]